MKRFLVLLFCFVLFFNNGYAAKKYIYSDKEYERYVLKLIKTKLKRFENKIFVFSGENRFGLGRPNKYFCFIEVNFSIFGEENRIKINLLSPPYKINRQMKKFADNFLTSRRVITAKSEHLIEIREYFFENPTPIEYVWNLTLNAEDVFKYRGGNCFAITNYFIGLTRYLGLKSYYYYFPYTQTSYVTNDILITTTHIVCGIDIGSGYIPFVIDYLPDVDISYNKLFKLKKIKKISDIEAAGLFYSNWGVRMMLMKNYGTAEFLLLLAEGLNPESANIKNNLGVLYKNMGSFEKSADYFLKAISLTSNFQGILSNLIKIEKNLPKEKRERVKESLTKALDKNYYWHLKNADEFITRKDFKKAYKELKKADKLSPNNQEVYIYFMKFASKTGDKKLYEKYSKKIKKIDATK